MYMYMYYDVLSDCMYRKQLCLATKTGVEKQSRIDELERQLSAEQRDRNKLEGILT